MDVISISDGSSTDVLPTRGSSLFRCDFQNRSSSPEQAGTFSSESTQRCPVSWKRKQQAKHNLIKDIISENIPCAKTKVNSWLKHNDMESESENVNVRLENSVINIDALKMKGSIFIRHDYNKDISRSPKFSYSYYHKRRFQINDSQKSGSKSAVVNGVKDDDVISIDSDVSSTKNTAGSNIGDYFTNVECGKELNGLQTAQKKLKYKSVNVNDVPLSPESQKKNELCSYLQLMNMNCSDKKIGNAIQNRRSIRVRNLTILSERRKLEKKLLFEAEEKEKDLDGTFEIIGDDCNNLSSKSFAELNMNIPETDQTVKDNEIVDTTAFTLLNIEVLRRILLEKTSDFDDAMKNFLDAEKIQVNGTKLKSTVTKKLPPVFSKKILKLRNLRSNLKLNKVGVKRLMLKDGKKKTVELMRTRRMRARKLQLTTTKLKKVQQQQQQSISRNSESKNLRRSKPLRENTTKVDEKRKDTGDYESIKSCNNLPKSSPVSTGKPKLSPRETQISKKSVPAFEEKIFSIIDLSHSKTCSNVGSLLDHDYATKVTTENSNAIEPLIAYVTINPNDVLDNISSLEKVPAESATNQSENITQSNDELEHEIVSLTVLDKPPPPNIFEDSQRSKSPSTITTISELREVLSSPECDLNKDSPITKSVLPPKTNFITLNTSLKIRSLHKNLTRAKRKARSADLIRDCSSGNDVWDDANLSARVAKTDDKKSYSIRLAESDGRIFNAFYLDFYLIVAQERAISFWSQSALGNMLSAQNMWISKGAVQRLVSDGNCVIKKSSAAVISSENSIAYIEFWIKEHKSDKRERPVADIFATIYFCRHRLNGPDKKVLQLENINGFACDIQYVVLRNSRNIIVSWCETCNDERKTYIHCYSLASDYQTVVSIKEMEAVGHYITSLHNIEDCDTLVMGCGENKVSLWNVEYCYVVATIDVNDSLSHSSTLWVKCDRGFLFMLQLNELEKIIKLIAINGITQTWKRLKVFRFPTCYKGLRGVCVDNNILAAFFENGVVCWNIHTAESVIEEITSKNAYIPSEKHIIMLSPNCGILVRHALSHFLTNYGS